MVRVCVIRCVLSLFCLPFLLFSFFLRSIQLQMNGGVCVCEIVYIAVFYVCAHVVCITSCLIMYILTICGPIKSCLQNQGVKS